MTLRKTPERRAAFRREMGLANEALARGADGQAFAHLERAHILGQPWPLLHSFAHWKMLLLGLRRGDAREVRGQVLRLAAGGILSAIGRVPEGNTGGANVQPEKPMPLPADLEALCSGGPSGPDRA